MLAGYYSLPLGNLLTGYLTVLALALTVLYLSLLLLAHAVPFLAYVANDVSHSPGWIVLL